MKTLLQWIFEQIKCNVHIGDVLIFFEESKITFWYRNELYSLTLRKIE